MVPHPTFFVRRSVYERYGYFNLEMRTASRLCRDGIRFTVHGFFCFGRLGPARQSREVISHQLAVFSLEFALRDGG
jgi:hypothetical protein